MSRGLISMLRDYLKDSRELADLWEKIIYVSDLLGVSNNMGVSELFER